MGLMTKVNPKAYPVERLDEIERSEIERLQDVGVETTQDLLAVCRTPEGRDRLRAETGISEERLTNWLHLADLLRVRGVGPQFAELLLAAGVGTVPDLAASNPDSLAAEVARVRRAQRLSRAAPPGTRIRRWVAQARSLEPTL